MSCKLFENTSATYYAGWNCWDSERDTSKIHSSSPIPPNSGNIVELGALDRHSPSKINGNVCQEFSDTASRGGGGGLGKVEPRWW